MAENPGDLARWWSYVSLDVKGGGFLVNFYPRTASFLRFQMADLLAFYVRNLAPALFLPAILAVIGWLVTVRDHPRRAVGWLGLFLCAGVGAVVYFNLPKGYIRSMDRHYLPSLVVMAPWVAVGAARVLRAATGLRGGRWLAPAVAAALAIAPLAAWSVNRRACDLSRQRFAEGFARDLLEPLPEHAILLTNGDNDTFPLWCMQQVEGVRRDVAVVVTLPPSDFRIGGARRQSDPLPPRRATVCRARLRAVVVAVDHMVC